MCSSFQGSERRASFRGAAQRRQALCVEGKARLARSVTPRLDKSSARNLLSKPSYPDEKLWHHLLHDRPVRSEIERAVSQYPGSRIILARHLPSYFSQWLTPSLLSQNKEESGVCRARHRLQLRGQRRRHTGLPASQLQGRGWWYQVCADNTNEITPPSRVHSPASTQ